MAAQGRRRHTGDLRLIAIAAATLLAAGDWVAVARGLRRAEGLLKPLVPLPLIAVAVALHSWWFAAALALCLAGDVLLLPQVDRFRGGLAAFLLGHLAFIGGFLARPLHPSRAGFAAGALLLVVVVSPPIFKAVPRPLRLPVLAYILVIFAMNVAAFIGGSAVAAAGASLFAVSDALLAWNRFVRPAPGGRVAVMVTYHLAIVLLTLSLLL